MIIGAAVQLRGAASNTELAGHAPDYAKPSSLYTPYTNQDKNEMHTVSIGQSES